MTEESASAPSDDAVGVIVRLLAGSITREQAAATLDITPVELARWRDAFLAGARRGLRECAARRDDVSAESLAALIDDARPTNVEPSATKWLLGVALVGWLGSFALAIADPAWLPVSTPWLFGLGGLFWALGSIYTVVGVIGDNRRRAALLRDGSRRRARIVHAKETGTRINKQPVVRLTLLVLAEGAHERYAVLHDEAVPVLQLARVHEGETLDVRVDPADAQRMAVEWAR